MTTRKSAERSINQVLSLLENVRPSGNGYSAQCPGHDDRNNSLSVSEGEDGRVLLNCFAGCATEAILAALGLEWEDLFSVKKDNSGGLTLQAYAEAKGFTVSFLQQQGVSQIYLNGISALRFSYMDRAGAVVSVRLRVALEGLNKFRWKTGSKPCLYGLWRLRQIESKYVVLVEGESDAQTLWFNNVPALGLPGAATWDETWSQYFDGFERIYIVIEPDKGGEAVLKWLGNSKIRNRARLITMSGVKDPSELYLRSQANFIRAWKAVIKAAVPWRERENQDRKQRRKAAWAKCRQLARRDDILKVFTETLAARGVVGERRAAKILYLTLISRFLSRPTSVVVNGPSSAGKSFLVEQTLSFFPTDAYYPLTGLSEKALAYSTESLSQRFLVLYEGEALNG
jgi:hypothetical protein